MHEFTVSYKLLPYTLISLFILLAAMEACRVVNPPFVPLDFSYSDYEDGDVKDSMFQVGEKTLAIVFVPDQVAIVKKMLHDARAQKFNFGPTMKIMGDYVVELERKIQALIDNLVDRWIAFNVRLKVCPILLQRKLSSL